MELTKSIEQFRKNNEERNGVDSEDDDEDIEQCKTLHTMKNMGSHRSTPQAQPVQKIPLFKCGECKFEFKSEDVLNKHKAQHHRIPDQQPAVINSPSPIPVVMSKPRPTGIVSRQYNCHECDFQGHRGKALYKHSILSKHSKIDSLAETCYTCKNTFDNFMVLMKHRKEAHYDTISECHSFKAGDCKFGSRCYYRHSVASEGVTSNTGALFDNNTGAHSETKRLDNDSFHEDLQIPPDLKELTKGLQKLMLEFLLNREKTENRHRGF